MEAQTSAVPGLLRRKAQVTYLELEAKPCHGPYPYRHTNLTPDLSPFWADAKARPLLAAEKSPILAAGNEGLRLDYRSQPRAASQYPLSRHNRYRRTDGVLPPGEA